MSQAFNRPLISVIIPTYNRALLLQKAIASIVAQTYSNWELIIVDDGSTDETAQLVRAMTDVRISILELLHVGNIGYLFNAGVRASKGEWIAFLASDDVWMINKLELQLETVKKTGLRWCYANFELMNELEQIIPLKAGKYKPISGWIIKQLLTNEASVTMCSVLMQRSLFEEVNGFSTDPRLMCREDYELALRLCLKAEVAALPDVLVHVLEHPGRSTNEIANGYELTAFTYETFLKSKAKKELKSIARKRRGFELAEAASRNLKNKNYRIAYKQFASAFVGGAGFRPWLAALYRGVKGGIQSRRVVE